jgi:hypothetical protein
VPLLEAQLQNAKQQAQSYPDGLYTCFIAEIDQEVARWDSGGCTGVAPPPGSTDPSADLAAVFADWRGDAKIKIVKVKAKGRKGRPRDEFVTIKNVSKAALPLKGLSLRDRSNNRLRLPRTKKLGRGRAMRVITGCFKNSRRPRNRPGRFYACKKRGQLWNDKGDVVKIVKSNGTVIAQRGFKRFRAVPRF